MVKDEFRRGSSRTQCIKHNTTQKENIPSLSSPILRAEYSHWKPRYDTPDKLFLDTFNVEAVLILSTGIATCRFSSTRKAVSTLFFNHPILNQL